RKYDIPVEKTVALVDYRFLSSQQADGGWGYLAKDKSTNTMTCAGLIGLAVGYGSYNDTLGPAWRLGKTLRDDPAPQKGLDFLGKFIGEEPADWAQPVPLENLYFIWSVEEVGMVYSQKEIGGKEWYPWAAHMLVVNQQPDGSWNNQSKYLGSTP